MTAGEDVRASDPPEPAPFAIYRVGGAVRDELLGLPVKDRDWVVVGATVEQMLDRGFRQVGRDFPVFLHPDTHEEYALARTERKTAPGYRGFVVHADPSVTIEDDLGRRDLTINAIAIGADGRVVDPHEGRADLAARMLRHVGPAFVEDPVRVLRLARFAARFPGFGVAPATLALMRRMSAAGELEALVAERVWQELSRGLMAERPSRMIDVLQAADAWPVLLPELTGEHPPDLGALDRSAAADASLAVRFGILTNGLAPEVVEAIAERLRVPTDCRDVAVAHARVAPIVPTLSDADPAALLAFLGAIDALRRPQRLHDLIAIEAALGRLPDLARWQRRLLAAADAAAAVDQAAIARATAKTAGGEAIRDAIQTARIAAITVRLGPGG